MPGDLSATGVRRWLPTDEALPRFSPMLHNLNALDISYDGGWHLFSAKVLDSLMDLMQLPSIVHLRVGDQIPSMIFNLAIGPNVKYLILPCLETCATHRLVQPPRQPINPVYLESLYIDRPFIFVALLSAPNPRLSLSSLRRLCVHSPDILEHEKIWQLLQFCLDTLEDFEFIPIHHGMVLIMINETKTVLILPFPFDAVGWPTFIARFEEVIDLGKIVSLKRFTVCISDHNQTNYVPWLNRIISSASGNQELEELCLKVICTVDSSNDTWWHGTIDTLLQAEFKSLKRLQVFFNLAFTSAVPGYGNDLYNHEDTEKLRSQRGVAVDIISTWNLELGDSRLVDNPIIFQSALLFDVIRFEQDSCGVGLRKKPIRGYLSNLQFTSIT